MANLYEVGKIDEMEDGDIKCVEVEDKEIALFKLNGEYFAIDNTCTHLGGPLCEGDIDGDRVICPWHGAEFDIRTGEVVSGPAEENVDPYKIVIENDSIKIDI